MSFLDVGQGDAILIQTPEYKNVLIDAGENGAVVEELGEQIGFFNQEIDLFILTHPHRDHFGGFLDVIQKYPVKQVMITGVISSDPMYEAFLNEIQLLNIPIIFPQNDQDIQMGNNVFLDILYPLTNQSLIGHDVDNKNNTSIVAHLIKSNTSLALLTGDAEHEEEKEILLSGQDVQSDILKLGHHGSRTATSDAFLAAVNPQTAIVSAGIDNKFEHPHGETMEKVKDLTVYQTMGGTIEFNF
ncbi:MBL fold metallo-hydrolase [Patescibacteria group bacterium]|nr:MBL fold metallo-hydrolase [Patescibacteria group bacterium]MBU1682502.1 MBL fold metallo-hydrolase [Patescibacteria group bacterium]